MIAAALALLTAFLALATPASAQTPGINLPPGFTTSVFASGLGTPRFLTLDPSGTLLVSIPSQGRVVALPDPNGSRAHGRPGSRSTAWPGLEGWESLRRRDRAGPAIPLRPGHAQGHGRRRRRPEPAAWRHPLDTNDRVRPRRTALRLGRVFVQCLPRAGRAAGRRPPLQRGRLRRGAVRHGHAERGGIGVLTDHGSALGHRQRARLARRRPAAGLHHRGEGAAASTAGPTA